MSRGVPKKKDILDKVSPASSGSNRESDMCILCEPPDPFSLGLKKVIAADVIRRMSSVNMRRRESVRDVLQAHAERS